MFMKNNKRTTLLRYWTTRYLFTLVIGLIILAAGSMWWIRQTTLENRLNLLQYVAVETADRVVQQDGGIEFDPFFNRMLEERAKLLEFKFEPQVFISDLNGQILYKKTGRMQRNNQTGPDLGTLPADLLENQKNVQKLDTQDGQAVYAVKSDITFDNNQVGWVVVVQSADDLTNVNQEYTLLFIMLTGLGLLGWSVIYFLSRKISRPIQEVAQAASKVSEGDYKIDLKARANEEEIHNLIISFKEMTERLMHLEKLRAELLAGVTHDLKTPVTSISGLIQAVRDDVVSGEEKEEFLDISLKEVSRLQKMIEDLLDFNSLSAGAFSIRPENCDMNKLVNDIVRQWALAQKGNFHYSVEAPAETICRSTDPYRLQQIMINLLNNAYHAIDENGSITVILSEGFIEVHDNGSGIAEEEQPYIFERFYRGKQKKLKVRGLGLGLPFSKLLANALNANLFLKESSAKGTAFAIKWNEEG
ncbi:sensor histidine kinase [Cytobacillus firmus]|uniref:sensor histidine kinase n=1 Tax=Cytobacillus firmus TaxID=1399 RepID=UPI001C9742FD|nr:HAMP domain-containing sensor histidine kinase [Cytobacillus firmus]MBY6052882.1 HAMP domain-containing histidine kinase [Cytobacillus firmus]URT69272.1 HAMP domain-containing histidine kinase [Cytobacillus firmus]